MNNKNDFSNVHQVVYDNMLSPQPDTINDTPYSCPTPPTKDTHAGESIQCLAIGDPHFRMDHLNDMDLLIHRILHIVQRDSPDFVVILGDLLHDHERIHSTAMNKVFTFIHALRHLTDIYILVGNHDYINNTQFLTTHHWMNAMKEWDRVWIVDTGMVHHTSAGTFIFCPYVSPGRFKEALGLIDPTWEQARAIFAHQEFKGAQMGAIISEDGDVWEHTLPMVISGHIHNKQRLHDNMLYVGTPIQHAFGETDDKTVAMCLFGETMHIEHIDLQLPHKHILYMTVDEAKEFTPPSTSNDHYRLTLAGTYDAYKQFRKSKHYKTLTQQGIRIVYRHRPSQHTQIPTRVEPFQTILNHLIEDDPYPYVKELYKELFTS